MPAPPPVETSVVVPWTSAPPVEITPAVAVRPLEAGWPKVRPELLKKVLKGSSQRGTSTTVGIPAVTVAPPAPFDPMLARYCEIMYDKPSDGVHSERQGAVVDAPWTNLEAGRRKGLGCC